MTPAALREFLKVVRDRHARTMSRVEEIAPAASETESTDQDADAYAEGLFFRVFTNYENDIETLFLHYVTGGASLGGTEANSYLNVGSEELAKKIIRGGWRFLSWSRPKAIRDTAETYMEDGWPICVAMNAKSQELSDCERIRNRIAHKSTESLSAFNVVQRNVLGTERLFAITPGQLLRIRNKRFRNLHMGRYFEVMTATVQAIVEPPP